jgi:shikimate kinase
MGNALIFCGIKHCGKSTLGRTLARQLGIPFTDTDEMLENLEKIMTRTIDSAGQKYSNFMNSIQSCLDIVNKNRQELAPDAPASSYSSFDDEMEEEDEDMEE